MMLELYIRFKGRSEKSFCFPVCMEVKMGVILLTEHRILSLIAANPRSGRSFLCDKLNEEGLQLTQANIRTSLQRLANAGYIKIHRTRGGCEITELGALVNTQ